jgi:hypothetical protein
MFEDLDRDFRLARAILRAALKLGAPQRVAQAIARSRSDPSAVHRGFEALGADPALLAVVSSGRLQDPHVVAMLEDWAQGRPLFGAGPGEASRARCCASGRGGTEPPRR